MARSFGVQVYDILPSGCLNGVYANPGTNGSVYNEIARKKEKQKEVLNDNADSIIGDYDCFYFDLDNERCNCNLAIRMGTTSQYVFTWTDLVGNPIFTGEGWKTSGNQITIQYR